MWPPSAAAPEAELTIWIPFQDFSHFDAPELAQPVQFFSGLGPPPAEPQYVRFWAIPHPPPQECLDTLRQARGLEVLQLLSSGFEHVLPYLPLGATLCNAPQLRARATAEAGLTLILAACNDVPTWVIQQHNRIWEWPPRRPGLAGRRVLLIGFGAIGQALGRMLSGFDVEVVPLAGQPRRGVAGPAELPALLPTADVVVLAVPLTSQTRGLVDASFLRSMKPGALLVNIARGEVVDTPALVAELRRQRIRAALDVTDPEPLPSDHELWQCPGVLISPHIGGHIAGLEELAAAYVAEQVGRYVRGQRLEHVVYPRP
jgi:phosphoglycerate dehydrogenase-like enzyme